MPARRIWTGLDAWVEVYHTNDAGVRINLAGNPWTVLDGPLLDYCFFQNVSLSAELPSTRRPVTGRPQRKLTVLAEEYSMDVEHFYLGKAKEVSHDVIFHREKILELVLRLQAPESPPDLDLHTLKMARRTSWDISGQENGNMLGSAKFTAEQFS